MQCFLHSAFNMAEHFSKQRPFWLLQDTNITSYPIASELFVWLPNLCLFSSRWIARILSRNGIWQHKVLSCTHLWWVHPKCRWVSKQLRWFFDKILHYRTLSLHESTLTWDTFQQSSVTDSRTGNWLLMASPLPQTLIIVAYIYFVTVLGPKIMENRKAFDMKGVLIVYNFSVVALSIYMCYEVSHRVIFSLRWNWNSSRRAIPQTQCFCAEPIVEQAHAIGSVVQYTCSLTFFFFWLLMWG